MESSVQSGSATKSLVSNSDSLDIDLLVGKAVSGSFEAFDQIGSF